MITVTVQRNNNHVSISFPCSDEELQKKLEEVHRRDESDFNLFIQKVEEPKELSMLQDRFVNLDELNYLAKRMDSFIQKEMQQFFAAANYCGLCKEKDLINLTFNLSRFTLIQDLSSMESVGQTHQLNLEGGLSEVEMETTDFAAIGKELMNSGKGKITEYGILFINDEIPFDEVYDGQVFPEYYHSQCLFTVMIESGDKVEYTYLPCDELSIEKAFCRLGIPDFNCSNVMIITSNVESDVWDEKFEQILADEGVFAVNDLAGTVNGFRSSEEWDKLAAVAEYAKVTDSKSLIKLARHLDSFEFIPEVQDQEDLARWWIEKYEEYKISPELEDFFLYEQYGEQLEKYTEGGFLPDGGYVYMEDRQSIREFLKDEEEENMTMGGL